jgi:3-oxoacyl-[acyl-carrier protein] reductase
MFKDKVVVVTGASVGIGREISVAFASRGANVVVNYRSRQAEAQRTAELVREAGGAAHLVQANVACDADCRRLVAEAVDTFGSVHVLVNNAGITSFVPFADLEALQDQDWDDLYAVNVKGPFQCARAAIPHMRQHGQGCIINIASQSGVRPQGSSLPYSATKAAVIHLTKCFAVTFAPQVRSNCIAPGFIDETMWNDGRQGLEALKERTLAATPLKKLGKPRHIADAAIYLASPGARYVNGAVLTIDGGRTV